MRSDYSHWESDFIQRKYRDRNRDARFESETYFLSRIARNDSSLLDVGCAEGGLFHALSKRIPNVTYVGVDVSAPLVERARELTPRQEFVTGNILECPTQLSGRTFDITVATGVFQHERGFKNLLDRMVARAPPTSSALRRRSACLTVRSSPNATIRRSNGSTRRGKTSGRCSTRTRTSCRPTIGVPWPRCARIAPRGNCAMRRIR